MENSVIPRLFITESAQLSARSASGIASMCACRSLYRNVKNGNSVISLPGPGGMTRLGSQYQSPRPNGSARAAA